MFLRDHCKIHRADEAEAVLVEKSVFQATIYIGRELTRTCLMSRLGK